MMAFEYVIHLKVFDMLSPFVNVNSAFIIKVNLSTATFMKVASLLIDDIIF